VNFVNKIRTARALLGPPRPFILYHKPTARCDCHCRFCDFWKGGEAENLMTNEEVLDMIDRAHAAGFTTYTLWGGEPLIAEEVGQWLASARSHGMQTVMCTAGKRLSERASEIGPHLERLLLSVEATGERHNSLRGTPGLFEAVTKGIDEFKRNSKGEITFWSNLTRENVDQVDNIARFAREKGAVVEFFPAALYPGYNEELVLSPEERKEVFGSIKDLKRSGLPVANTNYALDLMGSGRPFRCNLARLAVQVGPDGSVFACETRVLPDLDSYGDARTLDFSGLPKSVGYKKAVKRLSSCNLCLLPCVANMADGLFHQVSRKIFDSSLVPY